MESDDLATTNYNLPTITGNMNADVVRDMNALAEATDAAIKTAVDGVDLSVVEGDIATVSGDLATHLADGAAHGIGDKSTLKTSNKTSIVAALNELFTNVSNGKSLVGGAITDVDPNVVIPTDPTFQNLADAIGQISTGKKWASGTYTIPSGTNFKRYGSSNFYPLILTGLDFIPSMIYATDDFYWTVMFPEATSYGFTFIMSTFSSSTSSSSRTIYQAKNEPPVVLSLGMVEVPTSVSPGDTAKWFAYE